MVDPLTSRIWMHRCLFLVIASAIIFIRLLPVSPTYHGIPGPDLTLAFALAWVQRRPDYVPALLIIAVFFVQDLVFWRVPGLWTLIVLLATEWLRKRELRLREMPFAVEIAMTAVILVAMVLLERLVMTVLMLDQPPLGRVLLQALTTLIAYPVVIGLSRLAFGLKRAVPGEVDDLGHSV
ncbi:rod shape-determining protein MreD [Thioclava sp. GXIMD4216]|uniref:Rod shape-determining protein MreD n=1 Tax=Thioclava litoralis TaxID=3076557 RepID=A0ABZ1DZQ5_9RHOB|nr:rod shape-determining protein MreD [Thioclava sp. FTW29]